MGWRELTLVGVVLTLLLVISGEPAYGVDRVWIVGGGPSLLDSQAQIEKNAKWLQEVIRRQVPSAKLTTLFNGGATGRKDVVEWRHPPETVTSLQPLARVFGDAFHNGQRYYPNTVPGVAGSVRADALETRLHQEFAELRENDKALFIFYGHGGHGAPDAGGNTMRLWDNTQLTARGLGVLLAGIDPRTRVRLFLPQCFSGGFARTIYSMARATPTSKGHDMCGFMAVADDKQSEGCSASINVEGYRDYATYFFAALDRRTRLGKNLATNPDRDGDGTVTLREAHLYSLVNGESADVPRATSEVYLEDWQPWYLRWVTVKPIADNIYRKLAEELATRNGLPSDEAQLANEAERRLKDVAQQTADLKNQQDELKKETDALQAQMRTEVLARWPEARYPYTKNFLTFLRNDLGPAQRFISHHADYARLIRLQERNMELDEQIVASDRQGAQFEKIIRLQRLAQILDKFERVAVEADRAEYDKLIACEDSSL